MSNHSKTAVVIFSRTASLESSRKLLISSFQNNKKLHQRLWEKTMSTAEDSGFTVFNHTEELQTGNSFGERLINSIEYFFEKGFDKVITVGSDCPDLTVSDFENANDALNNQTSVIGPDRRGGLYLIGLTREQFDRRKLLNLPWQTDSLADWFQKTIGQQGETVVILELKFDLNESRDLHTYRASSHTLSSILVRIENSGSIVSNELIYELLSVQKQTLRGPPRH